MISRRAAPPAFEPASLGPVYDYVMGPVLEGLCKMESIYDGSLSLIDFAIMNDALVVRAENHWRGSEAARNA